MSISRELCELGISKLICRFSYNLYRLIIFPFLHTSTYSPDNCRKLILEARALRFGICILLYAKCEIVKFHTDRFTNIQVYQEYRFHIRHRLLLFRVFASQAHPTCCCCCCCSCWAIEHRRRQLLSNKVLGTLQGKKCPKLWA